MLKKGEIELGKVGIEGPAKAATQNLGKAGWECLKEMRAGQDD